MKHRYIALTDIYRLPNDDQIEIDDVESLCRLLLYSNDIDLEGIIVTTSFGYTEGGKESDRKAALDIIDAYEQVKPNLDIHASGYPDADYLRGITVCGISEYGEELGRGFGHERYNDNPGVNRIISAVDKDDPRPVWIGLWGGCNTLAQAVWKVWKSRSEDEFNKFLSKLRIYGISDQDKGGIWMRENFGDRLFYIVSPAAGGLEGVAAFETATWQGIAYDFFRSETLRQGFKGANSEIVTKEWIRKNICGETPYRRLYPVPTMGMEGDTPSYLGLIPNGLNNLEHPNWGSWGGRYEKYIPAEAPFMGKKERFPIWTNADDTVVLAGGETETSNFATIWRWREAFQNDFLARLHWTEESDYHSAPHAPVVILDSPSEMTVKCGEKVALSAEGSYDPNGFSLTYHWFNYPEAGSYTAPVRVDAPNDKHTFFTAPDESCTLHFILEVTNQAKPAVTRYARVIVKVER